MFAVSTVLLNHAWVPWEAAAEPEGWTAELRESLPEGLDRLETAHWIAERAGVVGEIQNVFRDGDIATVPVALPGARIEIRADLAAGTARVERRATTLWDRLIYMHRTLGPHLAGFRGNWVFTQLWRALADATVALLLFSGASGIYLWLLVRAQRRTGLACLGRGHPPVRPARGGADRLMPPETPDVDAGLRLRVWNRRLHNYVGLYLLWFVWLFAVSGLILNHPTWAFPQFWPDREQSSEERPMRTPPPGEDLARAQDLMAQLGVSGEIERLEPRAGGAGTGLEVRVLRPGRITDISADFAAGRATSHAADRPAGRRGGREDAVRCRPAPGEDPARGQRRCRPAGAAGRHGAGGPQAARADAVRLAPTATGARGVGRCR